MVVISIAVNPRLIYIALFQIYKLLISADFKFIHERMGQQCNLKQYLSENYIWIFFLCPLRIISSNFFLYIWFYRIQLQKKMLSLKEI